MAEPTRIRAQVQGDKVVVRALFAHEMESGQRQDAAGKAIPAWFIREVQVSLNGRSVLALQWGPSVSKNPFLQVALKGGRTGGKAGDKVSIAWIDNRGDRRTDEATVA